MALHVRSWSDCDDSASARNAYSRWQGNRTVAHNFNEHQLLFPTQLNFNPVHKLLDVNIKSATTAALSAQDRDHNDDASNADLELPA